jgi:hypothetical protein
MRAADDKARDLWPAAESMDAVREAAEPGARDRVGAAATVIDSKTSSREPCRAMRTSAVVASAHFATFVSASETTY